MRDHRQNAYDHLIPRPPQQCSPLSISTFVRLLATAKQSLYDWHSLRNSPTMLIDNCQVHAVVIATNDEPGLARAQV